jgi:hypothetical protein
MIKFIALAYPMLANFESIHLGFYIGTEEEAKELAKEYSMLYDNVLIHKPVSIYQIYNKLKEEKK